MNNEYGIFELVQEIDEKIQASLQNTKRIKFVSFDVSQNYLFFGATSGALYVFNRFPCTFLKIIPSQEGAVSLVQASPDESLVVFVTTKGTICVVQNDSVQTYKDCQGSKISAIKWNSSSNELFIGDENGKVSVLVFLNFITKTVLKARCATLMQLDSRIEQIDSYSNFLLISTLTRSYICDTDKELYRQIGQKLRNGNYGGCFFKVSSKDSSVAQSDQSFNGTFRSLTDNEEIVLSNELRDVKIYCSRPGFRLWEALLDGTVLSTHHFKELISTEPNEMFSFDTTKEARLVSSSFSNVPKTPAKNIPDFGRVLTLTHRYILSYKRNCLFIFEPNTSKLLFWFVLKEDIVDAKLVKNFIYLWLASSKLLILLFSTLENIILKTFLNEQYLLCADLCVKFCRNSVFSEALQNVVVNLVDKISIVDEDLQHLIQNLVDKKICENKKPLSKKLASGIHIIENTFLTKNVTDNLFDSEKVAIDDANIPFQEKILKSDQFESMSLFEQQTQTQKMTDKDQPTLSESEDSKILQQEFEIYKAGNVFNGVKINTVLCKNTNVKDIIGFIEEFKKYAKKNETSNLLAKFCFEILLQFLSSSNFPSLLPVACDEECEYMWNAFKTVNNTQESTNCACKYPLPIKPDTKLKFYEIGCALLEHWYKLNKNCIDICNEIPYMYSKYFELNDQVDLKLNLPLIAQMGQISLIKTVAFRLTYDLWHELVLKTMHCSRGKCLNCDKNFPDGLSYPMSLSEVGLVMLEHLGAQNTVNIFLEHSSIMSKKELDVDFFQMCILKAGSCPLADLNDDNKKDEAVHGLLMQQCHSQTK